MFGTVACLKGSRIPEDSEHYRTTGLELVIEYQLSFFIQDRNNEWLLRLDREYPREDSKT